MKTCSGCKTEKPASEFYKANCKSADGLQAWCKVCARNAATAYRKRNPKAGYEIRRRSVLKIVYGLSEQEYDAMLEQQNNACAICFVPAWLEDRRLAVDHDHDSGKVRGLLCARCNRGIGLFDDEPARLRSAAEYLEERS